MYQPLLMDEYIHIPLNRHYKPEKYESTTKKEREKKKQMYKCEREVYSCYEVANKILKPLGKVAMILKKTC